jgi:hypothetical protein
MRGNADRHMSRPGLAGSPLPTRSGWQSQRNTRPVHKNVLSANRVSFRTISSHSGRASAPWSAAFFAPTAVPRVAAGYPTLAAGLLADEPYGQVEYVQHSIHSRGQQPTANHDQDPFHSQP